MNSNLPSRLFRCFVLWDSQCKANSVFGKAKRAHFRQRINAELQRLNSTSFSFHRRRPSGEWEAEPTGRGDFCCCHALGRRANSCTGIWVGPPCCRTTAQQRPTLFSPSRMPWQRWHVASLTPSPRREHDVIHAVLRHYSSDGRCLDGSVKSFTEPRGREFVFSCPPLPAACEEATVSRAPVFNVSGKTKSRFVAATVREGMHVC